MIEYEGNFFGWGLIFRAHGSAAARAVIPALWSTLFFWVIFHYVIIEKNGYTDINENEYFRVGAHPYVIGALIGFFGFLLTFRANFSYNRYWEATGAVFQMLSKWGDVANVAASFHMQSKAYSKCEPPSFGLYPELRSIVHERERESRPTLSEVDAEIAAHEAEEALHTSHGHILPGRKEPHVTSAETGVFSQESEAKIPGSPKLSSKNQKAGVVGSTSLKETAPNSDEDNVASETKEIHIEIRNVVKESNCDSSGSNPNNTASTEATPLRHTKSREGHTLIRSFSSVQDECSTSMGPSAIPSLFLQELCHRISLLSAVAMATLRNVDEKSELPLVGYTPGEPWPPVDPDALSTARRREFNESSRIATFCKFIFGFTRSKRHRTLYSYARPFRVLGGVSDAEMDRLKKARGDHARVMLAEFWLQEFLIREHLRKGFGDVAPPIISRLFQEVSNGALFYSQARRVTRIPFPFPHAQLTSLFVLILAVVIPFLYISWSNYLVFGILMNFSTVLCFVGMHEVARELENPFQNAPNDIPLMTLQAELNEALVQLQSGFHPDSYWTVG